MSTLGCMEEGQAGSVWQVQLQTHYFWVECETIQYMCSWAERGVGAGDIDWDGTHIKVRIEPI